MGPKSKKQDVIDPPKGSSDKKSKPRIESSSKKERKKRKKSFRPPEKVIATIWWGVAIGTFVVGGIGLIDLLRSLYLTGGPTWSYVVFVELAARRLQMYVYALLGSSRDIQIRKYRQKTLYVTPLPWEMNETLYHLDGIIKGAHELVPFFSRSNSYIIFAGGGNLRVHGREPGLSMEYFLKEIGHMVERSSLLKFPQKAVMVDDYEEAVRGWIALNYLTDAMLKGRQPIKAKRDIFTTRISYGALDIGFTSLRVSYELPPILPSTKLPPGVKENTRFFTLYGRDYNVYTKTVDCYGAQRVFDKYTGFKDWIHWHDIITNNHCFNEPHNRSHGTETALNNLNYMWGRCGRSKWIEQWKYKGAWYVERYGGKPDGAECAKEVNEMITNCEKYVTTKECPKLEFPPRPYNVTFVGISEFARYAQLARIEDGTSKENWKKKQKHICSLKRLRFVKEEFPSKTASLFTYQNLCLMITYFIYLLEDKLKLTETEWKNLKFIYEVDGTEIDWSLGYVAELTKSLPTEPAHEIYTLMQIMIRSLAFCGILTVSSLAAAFALRSSNTMAQRALQIPQ